MYKINDRSYAMEDGDNISFIRDGGGSIQLFAGGYEAMKSHDPDSGPHTCTEAEMIVLEVREHHEIPDSVADEGIQITSEMMERRQQSDRCS